MAGQHSTDIAIIGAGPVGLFAVFEAGMLGLRCHVIDALDALGGQCAALYPEKPIYDIPAYPEIGAQSLVERLAEQAAPFAPVYHLGEQVVALEEAAGKRWCARTSAGTAIDAKAVVIAAGGGSFAPNRPPLHGLSAYEGKSVFYAVTRRQDFAGKRLVIAGGGDSALDWALALAEVAGPIALVHRREKFRGAPESVARLKALAQRGRIELVVPCQLAALEGEDGRLSAVLVKTLKGEERRLPADALLLFYGLAMKLGPLARWGFALERDQIGSVFPTDHSDERDGSHARQPPAVHARGPGPHGDGGGAGDHHRGAPRLARCRPRHMAGRRERRRLREGPCPAGRRPAGLFRTRRRRITKGERDEGAVRDHDVEEGGRPRRL